MHRRLLQRRLENALATLSVSLTLLEREVCAPHDPRPPTRMPRPSHRSLHCATQRPLAIPAA
jgi:hypothetical protein